MIILGILSIIQMFFWPGLVVTGLLKFQIRGISRWVAVIGISLLVNYVLVVLLTLAHLYLQVVLLVIFALETAAIFWLYRNSFSGSLESLFSRIEGRVQSYHIFNLLDRVPSRFLRVVEALTFLALLVFALTDLAWVGKIFIDNLGTVFNTWDAVVSWNTWAVSWSQGAFPANTSYYPQLIPANWSLSYVFLGGNELQFFPKAIMPLFSFLILLMLFDLGIQTRSFGFFIGVILTRLLIKNFTGEFIADGYVDLPVTFFGFACVYFLLMGWLKGERGETQSEWLVAGCLLAAGAVLTKQAGSLVLILFPLLAVLLTLRSWDVVARRKEIKTMLIWWGGALVVGLSWYLFKWIQIRMGWDASNLVYVTRDIYHGAGLLDRASNALALLENYAPLLIGLIPAIFLVKPVYRWLGILLAIPYAIAWMFFFSYEARNLALIFPIWGLLIGLAVEQIFHAGLWLAARIRLERTPVLVLPILALAGLIAAGVAIPTQRLLVQQEEQQWTIFSPELDGKIRELVAETGTDIRVLTNYPINALPGLGNAKVSFWYNNLPDYEASLADPSIGYLLVPDSIEDTVEAAIQDGIRDGSLNLLFAVDGPYAYRMIQVQH